MVGPVPADALPVCHLKPSCTNVYGGCSTGWGRPAFSGRPCSLELRLAKVGFWGVCGSDPLLDLNPD